MTVNKVTLNQLDNQIGVVDPGDGMTLAICGVSSQGPLNTPGIYALRSDVVSTFGKGPMVESACYEIEITGKPVVLCRTADTVAGACGAVTETGTGTSVVTTDPAVEPYDDFEAVLKFIAGGTIGVAGITLQWSLDGGRNYSAVVSLGTANTYTIPDGNVKFNFGAGTIVAGDTASCRTTAPQWNNAELATALDALHATDNEWDEVLVEGPVVAADVATMQSKGTSWEAQNREATFYCSFRTPNAGESEATYKAAFDTAFGATVADRVCVCAGAADIQSPISQRRYMRRIAMDIATAAINVRPGQDLAEVGERLVNPRPANVKIVDDARNPKHHNELLNPGLDDSRATTYLMRPPRKGVFINNARLLSQVGSDFTNLQHRRVMNVARETARFWLEQFSSADLIVNGPPKGTILEEEASHIDSVINDALDEELVETRDASAVEFQLSRTDNLLSTFTLRGALRVTPLGYAKQIVVDVGFFNPALKASFAEEEE